MSITDAFLSRVDKQAGDDPCWLWVGSLLKLSGYGRFTFNRVTVRAHRASFLLFRGPIADGLFVCHRCDTPRCVNPAHLFLGTAKDNTQDMIRKGRGPDRRGVLNGTAKLNSDAVRFIRDRAARNRRGDHVIKDKSKISQRELAEMFGVDRFAIRCVLNGRTWRHVQQEAAS